MEPENPPECPNTHRADLSLRDYFAGQVLPTILNGYATRASYYNSTHIYDWSTRTGEPEAIASICYQIADAMLRESQKPINP